MNAFTMMRYINIRIALRFTLRVYILFVKMRSSIIYCMHTCIFSLIDGDLNAANTNKLTRIYTIMHCWPLEWNGLDIYERRTKLIIKRVDEI